MDAYQLERYMKTLIIFQEVTMGIKYEHIVDAEITKDNLAETFRALALCEPNVDADVTTTPIHRDGDLRWGSVFIMRSYCGAVFIGQMHTRFDEPGVRDRWMVEGRREEDGFMGDA